MHFKKLIVFCLLPLVHAGESADLIIYGNTSAAVTAAVAAGNAGLSVIMVGPDKHLGGLSAGGLGWTDSGNKQAIGGLSKDFYHRIWLEYQKPETWKWQEKSEYGNRGQSGKAGDDADQTLWVFEPHIAERVFEDLINENQITVHREEWLDREKGVEVKDGKIHSITMLSGKTFSGKMFLDSTYEGDLMAASGVSFHVGREANSQYGETLNGVQPGRRTHQFDLPIDPYVVPGDPASGLLPRISAEGPGEPGSADHRVQAYCFRMCLTDHDPNRIPFPKPEGYDAGQYELLLRYLKAGWKDVFNKFDRIQNHKTDTNNHGAFSFDNIGYNYDYPEASYERRKEIIAEHELYQKGLLYFLANDERVPDDIRTRMAKWGLPKDEFTDNGGWSHQLYIREARRMIGDFVVTENHLKLTEETPRSIGMGSYNMDSHNTQRYVDENGHARNEGDVQVGLRAPYPIEYGAIVPKKEEIRNLLVPVAVSASHIAYGSIRMEPVFMILGESAAVAAAIAIEKDLAVQDVPYDDLEKRLLDLGQVLRMDSSASPGLRKVGDLKGVVVDDEAAELSGTWLPSGIPSGVGLGYRHDQGAKDGAGKARFTAKLEPGNYHLDIAYLPHGNRATNVPVVVKAFGRETKFTLNQRQDPEIAQLFARLGQIQGGGEVSVTLSNEGVDGHVIIDAVRFLPVED
jgi:hypothetical protein